MRDPGNEVSQLRKKYDQDTPGRTRTHNLNLVPRGGDPGNEVVTTFELKVQPISPLRHGGLNAGAPYIKVPPQCN